MKNIAVLGSTGSIGRNALDIAKKCGHRVKALAFNKNYELALEQYYGFRPETIGVSDAKAYEVLKAVLKNENVEILHVDAPEIIAEQADYDVILIAIVGISALRASFAAAKTGKRIAMANKEALVVFGDTLLKTCKEYKTELIPVDSEHSAIFQSLGTSRREDLKSVILTCSGGPFGFLKKEEIQLKKAAEAIKHPKWNMGNKISVDSATLMNKGLEAIEAMRLFDVHIDDIEIVIHPESIVHSAVLYRDGSMIAQLSEPDMRIAIAYAIDYPQRSDLISDRSGASDFLYLSDLSFKKPDYERFPMLNLAKAAARRGGFYPVILNAANEAVVKLYLEDKIDFYRMSDIIEEELTHKYEGDIASIDDVIGCHEQVYNKILGKFKL